VPDPLVVYISVKSRLELVPPIGSDRVSPEREFLGDVANEVDGVGLRVAAVDLQRANSRIIIDGRVRVPPPPSSASESGILRLPVRGVAGNPCTQLVNATASSIRLLDIESQASCADADSIEERPDSDPLA